MAIDIGSDLLQRLITIIQYILIYMAKAVMWVGLLIISKQIGELFTQGKRKDKIITILKATIMILLSIALYFILI